MTKSQCQKFEINSNFEARKGHDHEGGHKFGVGMPQLFRSICEWGEISRAGEIRKERLGLRSQLHF